MNIFISSSVQKYTFLNYNRDYNLYRSVLLLFLFIRNSYRRQKLQVWWQMYLICCAKLIFLGRLVDGWVILLTPFNWQSKLNISFIDFFYNMTVFSLLLASCLSVVVVKCKYGFRSCIHPFLTIFLKLASVLLNVFVSWASNAA